MKRLLHFLYLALVTGITLLALRLFQGDELGGRAVFFLFLLPAVVFVAAQFTFLPFVFFAASDITPARMEAVNKALLDVILDLHRLGFENFHAAELVAALGKVEYVVFANPERTILFVIAIPSEMTARAAYSFTSRFGQDAVLETGLHGRARLPQYKPHAQLFSNVSLPQLHHLHLRGMEHMGKTFGEAIPVDRDEYARSFLREHQRAAKRSFRHGIYHRMFGKDFTGEMRGPIWERA